ncbi:MAG: RDD family protein [Lysobacterales bacterium]
MTHHPSAADSVPETKGKAHYEPASVVKVLLANLYDVIALTGVAFVATLPWAMLSPDGHVAAGTWPFQLYLLALVNAYFSLSWWRGGQTLGMRPWRMRLQSQTGQSPRFTQTQVRFWVAILSWAAAGLGMLWGFSKGGSWHDRASRTRAVITPKNP